jgi:geranylgeranyl reductase family protein
MDDCDVLIVGAGPAGSSCAWKLRDSGLRVAILDKQRFPRDKVCGGWITLPVVDELGIDLAEYSRHRVLQPIRGFRTSRMGGREVETKYREPVSYAIRRCEFDEFLLRRCGAHVCEGVPLSSLEKSAEKWIVNGRITARVVIGAGGHFCPVARLRGANARAEVAVAAQEIEFEMTEQQAKACSIHADTPELYFCPDMKGYGWCVRKKNFLNVGLGRLDPRGLPAWVAGLLKFLTATRKVAFDLPAKMHGHSYLLYSHTKRNVAGDGILLIGDAAGLAYSQSGEGIRPAVESGLLAAEAILAAGARSSPRLSAMYRGLLEQRFGKAQREWVANIGRHLPGWFLNSVSQLLMTSHWFSRRILLDRWFLHRDEPALSS